MIRIMYLFTIYVVRTTYYVNLYKLCKSTYHYMAHRRKLKYFLRESEENYFYIDNNIYPAKSNLLK